MWTLRNWPTVTIDIDHDPFCIALRKVSDATGVELRVWQNEPRLMQAGHFPAQQKAAGQHAAPMYKLPGLHGDQIAPACRCSIALR